MPRKKKVEKEVVFEDKRAAPRLFTENERKFILEEMEFLKQQEIDSGARAKWEHDQRIYGRVQFPANRFRMSSMRAHTAQQRYLQTGIVDSEYFELCVGHAPTRDDLVRCNCEDAGQRFHQQCGWCVSCSKPRYMCGHPHPSRSNEL